MIFKLLSLTLVTSTLVGCASGTSSSLPGRHSGGPEPPALPSIDSIMSMKNPDPQGVLTLDDALSLSTQSNPLLGSYLWEIRAREGGIVKARAVPNPSIDITLEDITGTGPYRGVDQAQTTLYAKQTIELGGKRGARSAMAEAEYNVARWDYETARRMVRSEVIAHFTDVAIAQERARFAAEGLEIAERLLEVVGERVMSGKVSPTEETKARVTLSTYRIDLDRARSDLDRARYRLAATWGSQSPRFDSVVGSFDSLLLLPSFDSLAAILHDHPDNRRSKSHIALQASRVERERTLRVPDITVIGGARRYEATGDYGVVLGLSLPLPLFDRNQGGIQEADARLSKAEYERRALINHLSIQLADRYRVAQQARAEAVGFRDQVLPNAEAAYDAVREGYALGRFGLIDVLDAERTLLQIRSRYLDALVEFNRTRTALPILAGDSFFSTNPNGENK